MINFIDIIKVSLLGILEGLTEFIPVSSTAHLLLISKLINFSHPIQGVFEIVIQLGAIMAVIVIYYKKILEIFFKIKEKKQQKFLLNLFLSFLPIVVFGFCFYSLIKKLLFSNLVIGASLIFGGMVMIFVEKKLYQKKQNLHNNKIDDLDKIDPLTAFKIGLFQCLAMIPGISRSGSTMVGALLLKLDRKTAVEFSFFLAIPTITSACFLDIYKNISNFSYSDIKLILIGIFFSFISSICVIKWLINFVSKNSFVVFGFYRILLGLIVILVSYVF